MMSKAAEIWTVRNLMDRMADTRSDQVFLVSAETARSVTFRELQQGAIRLYQRFREMGFNQGDKIAFLMENGLSTVQLFLSAMYGGFVSVPLNVRAGKSQLSYMLDHCDAKAIFVSDNYKSLLDEAVADISRPLEIVPADIDDLLTDSHALCDGIALPPVKPEDAALLMYSSGTTGKPNGAIHTHKSLVAHGRNAAQSHQLTSADRSLLVLPIYHINAECVTLLPTLTSGGSVVVPHGFVVSEFWDWLTNYGCTWSALVPTIVSQLLDWKDPKAASRASALQRIRFLRTSSGPLSPSLHREFLEKFKLLLIQAMGCSEGGNVFSNPLPPGKNKIGSPGFPWGFEARIIDRDGADVIEGEPGEVLLRGDGLMQGYYKDPASAAAAFDREGWFHTGDLAYRDQDGYFFVVGRSKELVIKGGMNIAPKQVDEVLESHPAVLEAAAVGVPDRYLGEDLVAFAVLRDGMPCSESELLGFCDERLGHFKTPTRIHFVSDLPKGPSGKVQRLRLVGEGQRLSTANSVLSATVSSGLVTGKSSNRLGASESLLEQTICEIWSDLLSEPEIDPSSNFFALGGQSLVAIQYLSRLRDKVQVILSLSDFFENPTVKQQAELVRKRLAESSEKGAAANSQTESQSVGPRDRNVPCRLSPAQDRLWFLEQLISREPVYNESEAVRLKGSLSIGVLERALNYVIERHEILRSTIEVRNGQPQAIVHEKWPIKVNRIDLSELSVEQREAKLARLLVDEPRRRYQLEAEPGIRSTVIKLAEDEHAFILMMHHIICDSSSLGILWREVASAYQACLEGRTPSSPPMPIQYWDYATWQRQPSRLAAIELDLSFWKEKLREAPEVLDLPMDRPRPPVNSYRGEKRQFFFDSELATKLRSLSRREQTSLFTAFAAALNALFYRYTGKDDILIGIPIADRDRPEVQSLIGFMIDTQVLRTDLIGNPSFRELMARVQRGVAEVYSHRSIPFDRVVDALRPHRSLSYSPLFQVMLNWRDRDEQPQFIEFAGLTVEPLLPHSQTSKFDITLTVTDDDDRIILELEYSTELFDRPRIERMVEHLRIILEAAVADPEQQLSGLPLLTSVECHQLVGWNQTQKDYPRNKCLHEFVEEQARRTPEATAVVFEDKRLTYRQLNERTNQLAHYLQSLGVGPDIMVGVCVERSLEMVVGLLGILKSGGAYVPLDPEYPKERMAFMLEDAAVPVLLTQGHLTKSLPTHQARTVRLDVDWPVIAEESVSQVIDSVRAEHLAYMIYTSGSTGRPKGAMNTHVAIVNRLLWMQDAYRLTPLDRVLQKTPFSFDVSVWEFFWPLLTGATLVIALPGGHKDGGYLAELIRREKITTVHFVPSMLSAFLDQEGLKFSCASLERVICSGEALPFELQQRFFSALSAELHNLYGPTEAAVDVTYWACERESQLRTVPIGRPIANTQIHILDQRLQPLPIGVPGELHIGGIGLARGYHNRPDLTAEKFISDPFRAEPGARLYKTGDLARYLPNGAIEYLGRIDYQVKVRGFRIELGEIESVLTALPGVREAVVVVREDVPGDKRLVAYLTTHRGEKPKVSELRGMLQAKLPEYMVPSAFSILDPLPLTPSGKVDRQALPAPEKIDLNSEQKYIAPATATEQALCRIWCDSLKLARVGTRDNFFDLGGYSLLAVRVLGYINKAFDVRLNVPTFFQNPTIEQLAHVIESHQSGPEQRVVQFQSGMKGFPIYLVGAGLVEQRIAQLIGMDRAIFGIDIRLPVEWRQAIQRKDSQALPTIEELARNYGSAMHEHAGSSPCVVVGCNFMGKVAFETARQLQGAGGNVAFVLLIDAFAWSGGLYRGPAWQSLKSIWRMATERKTHSRYQLIVIHELWRLARWLVRRLPATARYRFKLSEREMPSNLLDADGVALERSAMIRFSRIVGGSFHLRPLEIPGVLLRAETVDDDLLPFEDRTNGWGVLFKPGLEVFQMKGDHESIIGDKQNAIAVGRRINAVLDRYADKDTKSEGPLLGGVDDGELQLSADQKLDSGIRRSQKESAG
jgi:amino acid adenylation domain-containing protein